MAVIVCLGVLVGFYRSGWRIGVYVVDRAGSKAATFRQDIARPTRATVALRTETENRTTSKGAPVTIRTVYRGTNRVLLVHEFTNMNSRLFFCDNEARFEELDEDRDGFFECVILRSGWAADLFEEFTRTPDGSVAPLSGEEYLRLWEEMHRRGMTR